jgi:hypothetical protein
VDFTDFLGYFVRPGYKDVRETVRVLCGRLKWSTNSNRGKAKQLGLVLWELRARDGRVLCSNCFTQPEALARVLSTAFPVTERLLTDEIELSRQVPLCFDESDSTTELAKLPWRLTDNMEREVKEMHDTLVWRRQVITVEVSKGKAANRRVDVMVDRALSARTKKVVGDSCILTMPKYCIDLLLSFEKDGKDWRCQLWRKAGCRYTRCTLEFEIG